MRGGGGGRGRTGAKRTTIHINKIRFTDVKQVLFEKLENNLEGRLFVFHLVV